MSKLSIRVSEELEEKLFKKAEQLGVENLSDTVRILLLWALENHGSESSAKANTILLHRSLYYSVRMDYLLEECVLALVENGSTIRDKAYKKAERVILELLGKAFT